MIQLKPCDICGMGIGKFVCRHCGANVCGDHYDRDSGLCDRCGLGES